MVTMYVDESGTPDHADHTDYFVLTGVMVPDDKIKDLQKYVFEYKHANFVGDFIDEEIHTYDICSAKKAFESITQAKKTSLIDNLYEMVDNVDCTAISVVINKKRLKDEKPEWGVLYTAWSFLMKRYDVVMEENRFDFGRIKIDRSSKRSQQKTFDIISKLIDRGISQKTHTYHVRRLLNHQACVEFRLPMRFHIV